MSLTERRNVRSIIVLPHLRMVQIEFANEILKDNVVLSTALEYVSHTPEIEQPVFEDFPILDGEGKETVERRMIGMEKVDVRDEHMARLAKVLGDDSAAAITKIAGW